MKKLEIIKEINNYEAKLVWEIDKSKFYSMIGSDTNGTTYWLWYNLEEMKKKYLIELLDELKKENKMETMTTENDKVNEVVDLFNKIKKIFPKNSCGLSIHDIDIEKIDKQNWKIEDSSNPRITTTAKNYLRKNITDYFGITLFGKKGE